MSKIIKVKGISFNAKFSGNGCVNFDSNDQKYYLQSEGILKGMTHDNYLYAKKEFSQDGDKGVGFKYKVSSECIRHVMFQEEMDEQVNENVMQLPMVLYNAISMPAMIERGYMFAGNGEDVGTIKKKTVVTVTDAVEDTETLRHNVTFDFHSKSVKKETTTGKEKSDTSIYSIENVGECIYKSEGFINLSEMQFISCDNTYDRGAVNFDIKANETIYLDALKRNLPNGGKLGYYYMKNGYTQDEWAEKGILLDEEDVDFMTKDILKRILDVHIERRNALFSTLSLEIIYYDQDGCPVTETITKDNIDDFKFIPECKYNEADEALILANKEKYDAITSTSKKAKKTKKED